MASISPVNNSMAVSLRGVTKHYGALHAVDGVDLDIARGEIFGLIGHNGAGKSTLFKMMLGLIPATSGEILVGGASVRGRGFRAARRHLGYLPENVVLYDNLSGLETLRFFAKLKGAPLAQCQPALDRVGLAHAGKRPVREYSKGMRQRLGFAQALLGSPQVLFLDEPTSGLDPQAIRDFYATLRGLQAEGVTIIITSHILAELQERVGRLAILSAGKVQAVGSVQALREQTHMPLVFELQLQAGDTPAIAQALEHATAATPEPTAQGLRLACPREQKMAVLAALAPFGARVLDIKMHEPSLEDVFFGFSD
ncbi:MAG: copper ABC transporter ATP-binding protein [Acidovorax sp. 17-64-282]|nr:MAG: copper ABC transporter ATP-binding protein [Acidovorax sp. 35-64-16]OYY82761.1 MAG: copper ABC transporter ATP-binding protein [Acidovorax sp. 28-64-14]OYZ44253.1 MAG: copper ABC transporter ATP-binding protein [Acidovorax sp. 16-64-162]OYZ70569.1 MAG: copper ABC transporter ATP-binding protein [Acidovorax sp. 24-64-9]OZA55509.1 MAG: copper ABC transporter ATP-binding protein [Acidovorax sp. 17-64-282]OZA71188.1 MAG: copper ABC transporter ATP-binding protein [Acidovorax sp. 39-64-12]